MLRGSPSLHLPLRVPSRRSPALLLRISCPYYSCSAAATTRQPTGKQDAGSRTPSADLKDAVDACICADDAADCASHAESLVLQERRHGSLPLVREGGQTREGVRSVNQGARREGEREEGRKEEGFKLK